MTKTALINYLKLPISGGSRQQAHSSHDIIYHGSHTLVHQRRIADRKVGHQQPIDSVDNDTVSSF